ncbi:hypothetical protein [Chitinophaga filiformis]|uniref:Lipoprotein n=1 Tax=Chitinophaga filiformis TaxID=104663 RepID=A0A1G7N9Q0_CHIFI|nr:hypothetical protein [Chitinophaga filiformis]SDF70805.1 hypothetical protein SAMN04488121_102721 [Chitinophaga filiformis]
MIKHFIAGCFILLVCACGASRRDVIQSMKDNELVQEKNVNDYVFRLQYMPSDRGAGEDTSLVYFRLNVANNAGAPMKGTSDLSYSYGLDTLFSLVNMTDTICAVDITRVANGTVNGVEYMLVFDRAKVYAQPDCKLLFRDWLFTHQFISFPLKGSAIAHIDSLSLKI